MNRHRNRKETSGTGSKVFRESPGRRGSFRLVVDRLYAADNGSISMEFDFSEEVLRRALLNIYSRDFHPATEIEINLFNEIWAKMDKAAKEGFSKSKAITPDEDFRNAILRNNAVFSAFKVHRMQNDMARLLLDSNGILKPFDKWVQEVLPIASHQVRHWLRTEYDTAVIRAHQAADWQQFLRERDILPNLKWLPSTSIHPGADHRPFWNTIGRLMTRSGTSTDRATVGTASVTSRPPMKNLHRFRRTKTTRTSPSPDWITTRGKTVNCFQTIIHIRRKPTRVPKKRWINLWPVLTR